MVSYQIFVSFQYFRYYLAGSLLYRPGFISLAVCVGLMVDKVALGQLFLKYFNLLQSDITLTMSPIYIYSSTINASLHSERIPKKSTFESMAYTDNICH